jgi:GxxExxY protein
MWVGSEYSHDRRDADLLPHAEGAENYSLHQFLGSNDFIGGAMTHNEISGKIIEVAIGIHGELGPGLLESVYQNVLSYELEKCGLKIDKETPIPVEWREIHLVVGFRADILVENRVIVELKSVEKVMPVHLKQRIKHFSESYKELEPGK